MVWRSIRPLRVICINSSAVGIITIIPIVPIRMMEYEQALDVLQLRDQALSAREVPIDIIEFVINMGYSVVPGLSLAPWIAFDMLDQRLDPLTVVCAPFLIINGLRQENAADDRDACLQ